MVGSWKDDEGDPQQGTAHHDQCYRERQREVHPEQGSDADDRQGGTDADRHPHQQRPQGGDHLASRAARASRPSVRVSRRASASSRSPSTSGRSSNRARRYKWARRSSASASSSREPRRSEERRGGEGGGGRG